MSDNESGEVLFEIFKTKVKTMTAVYLGILLFVGWLVLKLFFSVEIPGHWLEKASYVTNIYVNVFPDNDKIKSYRPVGDLQRKSDCDNDGENDHCDSWYSVRKITFPNEVFIEFDDCQVKLDKKEYCIDYNGSSWYVELTNQKP